MQFFKGDELERQIDAAFAKATESQGYSLSNFYNQAYSTIPLGHFLFDNQLVPLSNAIRRDIFADAFSQIFEAWAFAGTFESYLLVFKKIFGDNATVMFEVPGPGQLNIDVESDGTETSPFVARRIVNNQYIYDNVVTHDGDRIVFRSFKGIESESELEKILFIMAPGGIFTQVSLTIST